MSVLKLEVVYDNEPQNEQVLKLMRDKTVQILNSRFVFKRKHNISPSDAQLEKRTAEHWNIE